MVKKIISFILVLCLLMVSIPAASAGSESTPSRTVEEILDEYHSRVIADLSSENSAAGNSRSINNSVASLTQETVNTLNATGYEAYHVTPTNYRTLENQLYTDFEGMGLNLDGSYIIVIHGDASNANNTTNGIGSRAIVPNPGLGGGTTYFNYSYNGKSYSMRYVTVTPAENSALRQNSDVELLEGCTSAQKANALNNILTYLSLIPNLSVTTTFLSLLLSVLPNAESTVPDSIDFRAYSIWNTTYTQVYDSAAAKWRMSTCVEYAKRDYDIQYSFYDPEANRYGQTYKTASFPNVYSEHYSDWEYMKQVAAISFDSNTHPLDTVSELRYKYKDTLTQEERVVITHQRWSEYLGYEPA